MTEDVDTHMCYVIKIQASWCSSREIMFPLWPSLTLRIIGQYWSTRSKGAEDRLQVCQVKARQWVCQVKARDEFQFSVFRSMANDSEVKLHRIYPNNWFTDKQVSPGPLQNQPASVASCYGCLLNCANAKILITNGKQQSEKQRNAWNMTSPAWNSIAWQQSWIPSNSYPLG